MMAITCGQPGQPRVFVDGICSTDLRHFKSGLKLKHSFQARNNWSVNQRGNYD